MAYPHPRGSETRAAALAAAFFRNPRRPTGAFLDFAIWISASGTGMQPPATCGVIQRSRMSHRDNFQGPKSSVIETVFEIR
jgi:hypothetical protein